MPDKPQPLPPPDPKQSNTCGSCGMVMAPGQTTCTRCGS